MNLELLDPFGRQVPDRIDATLQFPSSTQPGAATACRFNRRGTYLAVGYSDGSVAIFSTLNRTLSALYSGGVKGGGGVSSLSWSRRSRRLLVGVAGEQTVKLIDTSHPAGAEVASERLLSLASTKLSKDDPDASERSTKGPDITSADLTISEYGIILPHHTIFHTKKTSFRDMEDQSVVFVRESRTVGPVGAPQSYKEPKQFPSLTIPLPKRLGHSLQIHDNGVYGLAVCEGILFVFHVDPESFCEAHDARCGWTPLHACTGEKEDFACAVFGGVEQSSNTIYAVRPHEMVVFGNVLQENPSITHRIPTECAEPWHLFRHKKQLLINGGDGILRLYNITSATTTTPVVQFQDNVTKMTFADAAVSGDGEHVLAVVNGDTTYEIYIWNAVSGVLVDKLLSQSRLSSVEWHPVRAFVVGSCEDGIVDVWGPRINWTAFAPDFQALPQNVEYIEREDEYDLDPDTGMPISDKQLHEVEDDTVDVLRIDPVPVFASDSEDECEVFEFETRVKNIIVAKGDGKKGRYSNAGDD